ncbi:MAG: ABC transporter ATP-binding protein [Actinomycetota bacterium]
MNAETTAGGALRVLIGERRNVGLDVRILGFVGVVAAVAGLVQALVLLLTVRAATALTADLELTSGSLGPFSLDDLSVGETLALAAALVVVLLALEVASVWGQSVLQSSSQRAARRRMLEAFTGASFTGQTALPRGETQQLLNALPSQVASVIGQMGAMVAAALSFLALVAAALLLSPTASVAVVAGVGVLLLLQRPVLIAGRRAADRQTRTQRRLGAMVAERLELTNEVSAFGVGDAAAGPVDDQIRLVAHRLQRLRFLNRLSTVLYRIGALLLVLSMLWLVDASDTDDLVALTGAMLMLLRAVSYGQGVQTGYQALNEATPVVRQLADERRRLAEDTTVAATTVPDSFGALVLDDVSFAYPGQDPTIAGIDLTVDVGDFVAIVGPSGAGKSTLMAMLLGQRPATGGSIELGGVDTRTIDRAWWHRHVAFVPQESRLPSGSLREAVRFHRPWVDDASIEWALDLAGLSDDIAAWDDGLDAEVGQTGDRLSGGQRQRTALARAIAGRPKLLLLDEPTSALDPASEALIRRALESLRGDMTIVVIAHRPDTVRSATRIIRVDDGRVVEVSGDIDEALRGVQDH